MLEPTRDAVLEGVEAVLREADKRAEDLATVMIFDFLRQHDEQQRPWLSAEEAAIYLACPISRVRKLTSTGDLPTFRDGRRVLFRRDDLDAFIKAGGACT